MAKGYLQAELNFQNAKNGGFYVYTADGTFTTQADVFDPISQAVLSQPLTIDSNGYVQAFTVEDTILYDVIAKDYNGAVRFTRQNISIGGASGGIVGPQGPKGDKGDTGATGPQGPAGVNGQDGVNGTNGTDGANGQDGVGLQTIFISDEETCEISYTKTDNQTVSYVAGTLFPGGVGQVKTSVNDNLGYLNEKIIAGEGVNVSANNFDITITNTLPETYKVKANSVGVEDYLGSVLQAGTGISLQLTPDLSKIQIIATGDATGGWVWQGLWSSATTYNTNDTVNYYDASGIPVINRVYVATSATSANPYTDGTGWFLAFSIDTAGDQFVKLDADDVLNSYLLDKIKPGDGISFVRVDTSAGSYVNVNANFSALNVSAAGTNYSINDLGNTLEFTSGTRITPEWDGTKLKFNHRTAGASAVSAYKPTFDTLGHYTGDLGPLTVNEIVGLTSALDVAGDGKVKVTSADSKGYLENKIVGSDNVAIITSGSKLVVSATGEFDTYKVKTTSADSSPDYLSEKIIGGEGISVVTSGNELIISQAALSSGSALRSAIDLTISTGTSDYFNFFTPDFGNEFQFNTSNGTIFSGFNPGPIQINFNANVFFDSVSSTTPPVQSFRGYSPNAYYVNSNEQVPLIWQDWANAGFGGTSNSRYTFSADGKWQINWGAQMFSPPGSYGNVNAIVRHYSSTGSLKNKFDAQQANGFWSTSGLSNPTQYGTCRRSEVINVAANDYIELRLAIAGQAFGSAGGSTSAYQIDYSGHLIENAATTFSNPYAAVYLEKHTAFGTSDIAFWGETIGDPGSAPYRTPNISTITDHNEGDYYKIRYLLPSGAIILSDYGSVSFGSLVGAKGDPGDGAIIHGYGNIIATSGTSGVDITTTPNLSATYLTLNGGLTSGVSIGTIEYDPITDRFWITTNA